MTTLDPQSPVRADHRFIKKLMASVLAGKVSNRPEEFDAISKNFSAKGGSWVRLFNGSPTDFSLLKNIIKGAFDKDLLTKSPEWSA